MGKLHDQLRAKYPADRYALFYEVPDAVSLDARRRIDAVAVGIWKSVGRNITGFEFKASRADWLREVKQVDKADPFVAICDYFFLVTTDATIAKVEEIPSCWGWMTSSEAGLCVQRPATKIPQDKENLPWAFTVGLLRKLQDSLMDSADVRTAIEKIRAEAKEETERKVQRAIDQMAENRALKALQERVASFEKEAGIKIDHWDHGSVGKVVAGILKLGYAEQLDGPQFIARHLERQAMAAEKLAAAAREIVSQLQEGTR